MSTRRRLLAGVMALLVLSGCGTEPPPPDPAELDRWLRRYVELLNAGNEDELSRHLDRASTGEAADRIERYGGQRLTVSRITTDSEFPRVYRVRMEVETGDGQQMTMSETAEWDGRRWTLAPLVASAVPPSAASTDRPTG